MKIHLMVPCYVDQLNPEIGIASVEVLEKLGHEVIYPEDQTCCGQPPFNAGYHDEARKVARHCLKCFDGADAVVVPSGSCAAMLKVFYKELFEKEPENERARHLADNTWEFSSFLVRQLGVTKLGAKFPHKVTFHDGCHGLRELGCKSEPRALLKEVEGLELVEMKEAETCCGFGGTFAVKFPEISTAMAEVKVQSIQETGAKYVVSNDPSCMLQICGYMKKKGIDIKALHLAQVLNCV